MTRVVIVNSYECIKEALVTRGPDVGGRPQDSIPMRIAFHDNQALGILDYDKKFVFMRKLTSQSLHQYGSGMTNIEGVIIEEVEKMCSLLAKEAGKPILIHQYLGRLYLEFPV